MPAERWASSAATTARGQSRIPPTGMGVWGLASMMPVMPPFDEAGLRVRPVLALEADVSPDGAGWLSEVMVATVRDGRAHVVPVLVFSAAAYRRAPVLTR